MLVVWTKSNLTGRPREGEGEERGSRPHSAPSTYFARIAGIRLIGFTNPARTSANTTAPRC